MSAQPCTVRTARPGDLESVLQVHAEHAGSGRRGGASLSEQRMWLRMLATPDLTAYVAEIAGDIVGTATAMVMPNLTYDCAPSVFIEAVVVVPKHRRRGVATELLLAVVEDARTQGCNKIQLLSHKRHAHDGGHELYANVGFTPEAEGFRLYLRQVPTAVQQARQQNY